MIELQQRIQQYLDDERTALLKKRCDGMINDILKSASDTHQCRIHRGYHYPRSDKTAQELLSSESSFINEFSDAVMKTTENFYCVSKNDSLVNADEYIDFCNRNSLEFEKTNLELVDENSIQLCLKVRENLYDYEKLKKNCWHKHEDCKCDI